MESYDYQPIDGSKKRTAPKDGFDSLLPPSKRHSNESPAAIAQSQAEYSDAGQRMRWQQAVQACRFGEEITQLNETLSQKNEELKCQRTRIQDNEGAARRHGEEITQLNETLSQKNEELKCQRTRIHDTEDEARRRGEQIIQLEVRISQKDSELQSQHTRNQAAKAIAFQENEADKLQIRQEAHSMIAKLRAEIQRLHEQEIARRDATIADQRAEIQRLHEQEIASRDDVIAKQEAEMQLLRQQLASQNEVIAEQQATMQLLREQVASREEEIAEQQARMQVLREQEVASRRKAFAEQQDKYRIERVAETFVAKQDTEIRRLQAKLLASHSRLDTSASMELYDPKDIVDQPVATGLPSPPREEIAETPAQQSDTFTLRCRPLPATFVERPLVKKPQQVSATEKRHGKDRATVSHPTKSGGITKSSGRSGAKHTHVASKTNPGRLQELDIWRNGMKPLLAQSIEPTATTPDGEEKELEEYVLAEYLHVNKKTGQAISKGITGALIHNQSNTHAFWFQELDEGRVFTAELAPADVTPGARKRFLPDPKESRKIEPEDYSYMCMFAQFPEAQIEAARLVFENYPNRLEIMAHFEKRKTDIFGTCTNCEEKYKYPSLWERTVVWLTDLRGFKAACRAFHAEEETIVDGCGPWPARFTDPMVKYRTSLQPDRDRPEWMNANMVDRKVEALTRDLKRKATLDPMISLADCTKRQTEDYRDGPA